jgi:DNA-directed RNA polymerase omega subunit
MARVTIEDCRNYIPNRFELVILAAQRAKDLSLGMPPLINKTRDKDPVLALREIAAGRIDYDKLRELVITKNIDPMKRMFNGIKNTTPDLEDIFRDLAASASEESFVVAQDEYEEDIEELGKDNIVQGLNEDDEEVSDEDEDMGEGSPIIKQQQFDIDVTFQDEDVED